MVVKSFFISGNTVDGVVRAQLDSRNVDVRQGEWKLCIDSMTAVLLRNSNFPMTISTNLASVYEKDSTNVTRLMPAKICTLCVNANRSTCITLIPLGKKEWLSFENGSPSFELHFRNAITNEPVAMEVQAVILLERVQ